MWKFDITMSNSTVQLVRASMFFLTIVACLRCLINDIYSSVPKKCDCSIFFPF